MSKEISQLVEAYESGRLTRRQLVSHLSALLSLFAGAGATAAAAPPENLFRAKGLNHIALRVKNIERSRDFYKDLLGLKVVREDPGGSCFLTFGNGFLALFRGDQAQMDHYCYAVEEYSQRTAAEKLKAAGIEPRLQADRIYFNDPDGLTIQLSAVDHQP